MQILCAARIGLPQVAPPANGKGTGQRRMFDGGLAHVKGTHSLDVVKPPLHGGVSDK